MYGQGMGFSVSVKGNEYVKRILIPQKQMTTMLGRPVAENPIDRMFDAVFAHYGLPWQFWKCDINSESKIAPAIAGIRAFGFACACITVPYKIACIPHLDEVDDDVKAIGAANYMTIHDGPPYWAQ
ncbi:MAG: hypothetical protein PHG00_16295 [Methylococcales bacterium]|nr:hypothetical protein [Methylococcales bacterium]